MDPATTAIFVAGVTVTPFWLLGIVAVKIYQHFRTPTAPEITRERCRDRVKALDKLGRDHSGEYERCMTSFDS